jgi:hypothetical protein
LALICVTAVLPLFRGGYSNVMPGSRPVRRPAATVRTVLALVATLALGALAGCASEQPMPKVDYPTAEAGAQIVNQQPVSASPTYTGYAPPYNAITAQFTGIPAHTRFAYPMPWLTFSVTITNTSDFAFQGIDPLLVFGQCTCNPHGYGIAPSTSLQLWDAATGTWKGIRSSEMNSSGVYKYSPQLGSVDLGPKATATYRYRVQLSRTAAKKTGYVGGAGSLNLYVLQLPKHTRLSAGLNPEASVPLTYAFN